MLELRRYRESDAGAVWLAGGGDFLVGVIAGEVVATGALRRISATVAEIKRMRVDARFQRRGYGRTVLHALEARARELGYRTLRLDTTVKQLPSRLLYRSEGFAEVERTLDHPGETTIVFEKRLS